MKNFGFVFLALVLSAVTGYAAPAAPSQQRFVLKEYLGYGWPSAVMHRVIEPKPGQFFPNRLTFLQEASTPSDKAQEIPFQLREVALHPDGSLKRAELWFRTELPSRATRSFLLRATAKPASPPAADLKIEERNDALEISNAKTAVRLPSIGKSTPAGEDNKYPGPLRGVRLASGQWTAASQVLAPDGIRMLECETRVLERGPLVTRARVAYRFSNKGEYSCDVELRQGESLVRIDERYEKAGSLSMDFGANLQPAKFATKKDNSGNMQITPIDYSKSNKLPNLVGWDFYLADYTAVLGLLGGANDDLLAWVSTNADWLPTPYQQSFTLTAEPGPKLSAQGSLGSGHRHWGLLVGKGTEYPDTAKDLYRWWTRNVFVPLDKVANWQLVWPGMDDIEFPHTFFSKSELPAIRARLHADPTISPFMADFPIKRNNWQPIPDWSPEQKEIFKAYRVKYENRNGTARGISAVGAAYLYSGDAVYVEQLDDKLGMQSEQTARSYLDFFVRCFTQDIGELTQESYSGYAQSSMRVSDDMMQRYIGLELLLGSGVLSKEDKREFLIKLAFMTYVMHEAEWQPPVHMPDGSRPEGYGQGTPNQKHCAFAARAINACMLANHPMKKAWMKFAMGEVRAHYPWTISESGALLESPFYSSRDTLRYGPFWSAMTRAGVAKVAPDYKQWMNRPKKAYEYLTNMLTPKEPRMGGRRVYHPIGRSSPGVVDPTFMVGADPWGLDDPQHASLMRWAWEEQGKPNPDVMGTTGGRDYSQTLIAFSNMMKAARPLETNPLHSQRYEGMGAVLRSHPESDFESNILWRHDGFAWDLYAVNNGAVYFYGKGAPLLPRFGAYWSHSYGGAWMMDLPFGNRVEFAAGNTNCFGSTTEYSSLGNLADIVSGESDDKDWKRRVLFSKDLDRDDPVYLLVRDDVSRPDTASTLNWWFMTKNVAPDGLNAPGVVPIKIAQEEWVKNMGHNWKDAPKLSGQTHHFPGMTGVDVDLFIASPNDPQIVTDAASAGNFPYNVGGQGLFETQQLVRISQPAGKGYLTLLVPRWPGSAQPQYRAIADGAGVAITQPGGEDRLFLADKVVSYKDDVVDFKGRNGFARLGKSTQRLMAQAGSISSNGLALYTSNTAVLSASENKITIFYTGEKTATKFTVPDAMKNWPVAWVKSDA